MAKFKFPARITFFDQSLTIPGSFEEGGEKKFSIVAIIDPKTDLPALFEKLMRQTADENPKWKGKVDNIFSQLVRTGRKPDVAFVKEPMRNLNGDVYAGFENMFYMKLSNKARPRYVDLDRTELGIEAAQQRIYPGCKVMVHGEFWAQDNKFGRAIRASLGGVQFLADGDSFAGGRATALDDFDDLSTNNEDDSYA